MCRLAKRGIGFCSLREQYLLNAAIVKVKRVGKRTGDGQSEREKCIQHDQGEYCKEHG